MGAYSLNETKNKTLIFGKNFIFIMLLLIIPAFNIIIPGPSCSKGRHIHLTNLPDIYQLGSDLSAGLRYQMLNNRDQLLYRYYIFYRELLRNDTNFTEKWVCPSEHR